MEMCAAALGALGGIRDDAFTSARDEKDPIM